MAHSGRHVATRMELGVAGGAFCALLWLLSDVGLHSASWRHTSQVAPSEPTLVAMGSAWRSKSGNLSGIHPKISHLAWPAPQAGNQDRTCAHSNT